MLENKLIINDEFRILRKELTQFLENYCTSLEILRAV